MSETTDFLMRNTEVVTFSLSRKANFTYFRKKLEAKIAMGHVAQSFYQYCFFHDNNLVKFYQVEVQNDEDLQDMFAIHEYSGYERIELYVTIQVDTQQSRVVQSQVIDSPVEEQAEVDVIDEEEDEQETEVDDMVNEEYEDEQDISVSLGHVYEPHAHMTNLNLQGDEPSSNIFFTSYIQSDEVLRKGDKFPSKEACQRTIKKWHMANNVDFEVDRPNLERYIIICKNPECAFRLCASYRKRSDAWVIGSISQQHTCVNSNTSQDHTMLSCDLICQEILPLINCDPSVKVKTIISHIVTAYNYTPS
ncbi:uncharacterized protein LOC131653497 [Vicia villosa]|uniref:uncharacterized protein LOC131653497 n=1 Tax=Vicia villosa TaxID=3911 RepID=UPI00273C942D|nr:uncharacterized protein LOC131653497 [Vicia villosa]XP_058779637.1 uncharacterized protein LOC131653497 [Vicia villosa]